MRRKLLNGKMIGVLAVMLVLFMAAGIAEEERTDTGGQWKYVLEDGGAMITGYVDEPSGDLAIPGELDGYPVTAIGFGAFFLCVDLDGVSIPDSVTSIGICAFESCRGLISVTIPDSVTSIGDYAFIYCESLANVPIPDSVTQFGSNPFANCPKAFISGPYDSTVYSNVDGVLFEVQQQTLVFYSGAKQGAYIIPEGTLRIGESAFYACEGLTSVSIPGSVGSIGSHAFYECVNLISVTVPDSLASIGEYAFAYCENLTGVTIPASVTSIGEGAFYGCGELVLSVMQGSFAEQYAKENGIPYEYIVE